MSHWAWLKKGTDATDKLFNWRRFWAMNVSVVLGGLTYFGCFVFFWVLILVFLLSRFLVCSFFIWFRTALDPSPSPRVDSVVHVGQRFDVHFAVWLQRTSLASSLLLLVCLVTSFPRRSPGCGGFICCWQNMQVVPTSQHTCPLHLYKPMYSADQFQFSRP